MHFAHLSLLFLSLSVSVVLFSPIEEHSHSLHIYLAFCHHGTHIHLPLVFIFLACSLLSFAHQSHLYCRT